MFGTGEKSFEKYEVARPSEPTKRLLLLAMVRPELFAKPAIGTPRRPAEPDLELIQRTIREAHLDRLYGPMFFNSNKVRTWQKILCLKHDHQLVGKGGVPITSVFDHFGYFGRNVLAIMPSFINKLFLRAINWRRHRQL